MTRTSSVKSEHDGKDGREGAIGLACILDVAAHFNAVSRWEASDHRLQCRLDLLGDFRRLEPFVDVRLDGDGRRAIAPSQDGILWPDLYVADLAERNEAAILAGQGQVAELGGIEPFGTGAPRHDLDGSDVFTHLRDRRAGEQELQLLGDVLRRQPDQSKPVLVEHETRRWRPLAPILIHLARVGIGAHHRLHIVRDLAKLGGIGPHHAERDGEMGVRAKHQLRDPDPPFRHHAFGHLCTKPDLEPLARLRVSVSTISFAKEGSGSSGL